VGDALAADTRRLRRSLAGLYGSVSPEDAAAAGDAVAAVLGERREVRSAARVALYAALPDEVPTRPSFERLRDAGPELALPCPLPDGRLEFRAVAGWAELRPGRWGVLEPPPGARRCALGPGDVVLVPGVAFDREGHRLGRGAGYYDATFPPAEPAPLLIGVAWSFRLVGDLPHGSRDRRVDAIVTERGWEPLAGGAV
jgi:5-formyltetrahydrofolate cyclo-ligase